MTHLKLRKIEVDNPAKRMVEPLVFDVQMACTEEIREGVEFVVLYNVDVHSDNDDQVLSEIEIAPIPRGKVGFRIEADAPDIDLIPASQLFGLTSIIIVGKYREQQFIRIGYIADVSYPGIPTEELIGGDAEEGASEEIDEDDQFEEEDDEEYECECEEECTCAEEESRSFIDVVKERSHERVFDEEGREEEIEERVSEDSYSEIADELDKTVQDSVDAVRHGDIIEYCGYSIDKKLIEMTLMVPPVISLFEIDWSDGSRTSEDAGSEESSTKKQKTE